MGKSLDRAARVKDRLLGRSKRTGMLIFHPAFSGITSTDPIRWCTGPAQAQEPEETQKPEQAEASGQAQEPARAEDPELSDSEKTPQQLCIEAFETFVAGLRNPPYSKITQKITPVFEHTERKVQLLARVDEPRTSFSSGLKDHMSSDAHKAVRYAFCGRGLLRKKILDVVVNNLGFENLITGDVIWALHWCAFE